MNEQPDIRREWRELKLAWRRAIGATLLDWMQKIYPCETISDVDVHLGIGEIARRAIENSKPRIDQ
jgi:hypothetical protein